MSYLALGAPYISLHFIAIVTTFIANRSLTSTPDLDETQVFAMNNMDQKDDPLTDQEFIQRAEKLFEDSIANVSQDVLDRLDRLEHARYRLALLVKDAKRWF